MKKILCLCALLTLSLLPAPADEARPALEVVFEVDGAYSPDAAFGPLLLSTLGVGLRLAGGALYATAFADLSANPLALDLPATIHARTFEVGSNPFPGVQTGLRLRFVGDSFAPPTISIFLHIEQRFTLIK